MNETDIDSELECAKYIAMGIRSLKVALEKLPPEAHERVIAWAVSAEGKLPASFSGSSGSLTFPPGVR